MEEYAYYVARGHKWERGLLIDQWFIIISIQHVAFTVPLNFTRIRRRSAAAAGIPRTAADSECGRRGHGTPHGCTGTCFYCPAMDCRGFCNIVRAVPWHCHLMALPWP